MRFWPFYYAKALAHSRSLYAKHARDKAEDLSCAGCLRFAFIGFNRVLHELRLEGNGFSLCGAT